jgi:hypothetical protein
MVELFFNRDPGWLDWTRGIPPEVERRPVVREPETRRGDPTAIPLPRLASFLEELEREMISGPMVERVRGRRVEGSLAVGDPNTSGFPRMVECIVSSRSLPKSTTEGEPRFDRRGVPSDSSSSTRPSF